MVTDQEIASCVESLLRQAGPSAAATASVAGVVRELEAKFGLDLSHKASFIRDQIHLLLGPPPPTSKDPFAPHVGPPFQPYPAHSLAGAASASPFAHLPHHHDLTFRYPPPNAVAVSAPVTVSHQQQLPHPHVAVPRPEVAVGPLSPAVARPVVASPKERSVTYVVCCRPNSVGGSAPAIVAKGGFSGLFPDSSSDAFKFALMVGSPDTILWCDVQLTKDGIGICLMNLNMKNCTDIPRMYPKGEKVYSVNGVQTRGWFPVDYNVGDLANNVSLTQGIYSRTDKFDANFYPILGVEDVAQFKPSGYWLNVQHDLFYTQHNLSMRSFVLSVSKRIIVDYISSPEVGFLSSIVKRFTGSKTKLVYDPLAEYLNFVDNGNFSVDGVLTDFPITPAEAIGCYSHISKNSSGLGKPVIISHNGASGIYPGCTDLAYKQAVSDGADFIDCPVQMTQDGILVCMSSINLMEDTTVTKSLFNIRLSTIPEIQSTPGIFTFNLTWEEIQSLKPMISTHRVCHFVLLQNAAFLAERLAFSVTDAVISALSDSGYNNQTTQEVIIQSSYSSVLVKVKQQTKYKLQYMVDESIRDADAASLADMKTFADSVSINKQSIFPKTVGFITTQTGVVQRLQSAGIAVHVYLLQNEFTSQAWDFFSDPYVEVTTFVEGAGVDGVITDFPGTASLYRRNGCANLGNNTPIYMEPVQVGLIGLINPKVEPPALAPLPVLDLADVVEPPLPPVAVKPPTPGGSTTPPPSSTPSGGNQCTVPLILISVAVILGSLIFI
ncbi:hypothetical protein J5N97_005393 [Dioscorea zingiberensis]|uniref:glycerophosphodiester phosphodiesterase n=1 Tax=Dioscorea zingiberensis TaxID=325984 RepID=A0A9D5D9R8_9LILI|nr:hypothetical protein J5N97_005393 [Dioscorea zingiberensis]